MKHKRIIALGMAAVLLFTTGCTLPGTGLVQDTIPDSTEGTDITMAAAADNVFSLNMNTNYSFNPMIATNHSNQLVCSLVYENMVEVDNDFNVIPNVITEWFPNDDCTYWTFTIDQNHTFHDGNPVTTKDLRYSLERAVAGDRYTGRFGSYQGCTYTDDKLFVSLGAGDGQFIKLMNIPIIEYGTYSTRNEEPRPIGSGPYTYNEDQTALVAYKGYKGYKDLPVDTVYLKEYTEADEIINAFEDSLIDVVINDPSSYTNLGYASTNEVHTYATTNLHFIGFNQETDIGGYSNFRYAMQYAFDREYLVELLGGNAVATSVPMYPTVDIYPTELANQVTYNLDNVRSILNNIGIQDYDEDGKLEFTNGNNDNLELTIILCSDSSAKAGIVNRFKEDMATIGLTINVKELPWDDYYAAITNYENFTKEQLKDITKIEFDMFYGEVKLRNNFDLLRLVQERDEDNANTNLNFTNCKDGNLETLNVAYMQSGDTSRKSNYLAFAQYLLQSGPYIFIGFEKQQIITHRSAIRGVNGNMGNPLYDFNNWMIQFNEEEKPADE